MRWASCLVVGLMVCRATGARGEDSLEYLVAVSDSVFVAKFPAWPWTGLADGVEVEVLEVIKGKVEGVKRVSVATADVSKLAEAKLGLVFFRGSEVREGERAVRPAFTEIVRLDGSEFVCTMRMESLSKPGEILAVAREAARGGEEGEVRSMLIVNSPVALYRHDRRVPPDLRVPLDERTERAALRLLEKPESEWPLICAGLDMLKSFRSAQNVERVKRLLSHPSSTGTFYAEDSWPNRIDMVSWDTYPVRQAAQWLLKEKWGIDPGPVTLRKAHEPYERVSWGWVAMPLVALVCAGIAPVVLRRGRRTIVVSVLSVVVVLLAFVAVRGWYVWDRLAFATRAGEFELSSRRGQFRVLHVGDRPEAYGLLHCPKIEEFESGDEWTNGRMWSDLIRPVAVRSWKGFVLAHGNVKSTGASPYTYRLVESPAWVVVGVLGIWPFVRCTRGMIRWRRRRRRAKSGRCLSCGYDLRGAGERCPECGAERSAVASSAT